MYAPFGSICLVKAELLCTPQDRYYLHPPQSVPGQVYARVNVVENFVDELALLGPGLGSPFVSPPRLQR